MTKRAEVVHLKTMKYAKKERGVFSVTNICFNFLLALELEFARKLAYHNIEVGGDDIWEMNYDL